MAEHSTAPKLVLASQRKHCRHPASLVAWGNVADGIDTPVEAMKTAAALPAGDRGLAQAGSAELPGGDGAVLPGGNPRDLEVWGALVLHK
ncbi:MAG TPA: hypothetical protein VFC52_08145 [Solirubrobacterales bacterium]|nr:hypothetical protein [Solirubrobacterales bacterium]